MNLNFQLSLELFPSIDRCHITIFIKLKLVTIKLYIKFIFTYKLPNELKSPIEFGIVPFN